MIRLALAFYLLYLPVRCCSQDTVTIQHRSYSTTFDKRRGYPVKVEWWVTKKSVSCVDKVKRSDRFVSDPRLVSSTNLHSDYEESDYDRGHNFPAADAACDKASNVESFYYSNVTPQHPSLNRGDWKSLEVFVRELAVKNDSVRVWCGSLGQIKRVGKLSIPKQCWKVVYVKRTKEFKAYLFENNDSKPNGIADNEIALEKITKLTGFKF